MRKKTSHYGKMFYILSFLLTSLFIFYCVFRYSMHLLMYFLSGFFQLLYCCFLINSLYNQFINIFTANLLPFATYTKYFVVILFSEQKPETKRPKKGLLSIWRGALYFVFCFLFLQTLYFAPPNTRISISVFLFLIYLFLFIRHLLPLAMLKIY